MDIKIIGAIEIERALKSIPKEIQHSIQQQAHLKAAKPLIEKEKLLAPEGPTGNLVDSIGAIKVPLKRADLVGEIHVGPRTRRPYRGQVAHMVEFGTVERKLKGRGKYRAGTSRGKTTPKPFVAPALRMTQSIVLGNIQNETAKRILARMKKELGSAFIR